MKKTFVSNRLRFYPCSEAVLAESFSNTCAMYVSGIRRAGYISDYRS